MGDIQGFTLQRVTPNKNAYLCELIQNLNKKTLLTFLVRKLCKNHRTLEFGAQPIP